MATLRITVTNTNFERIKDISFEYDMTDIHDMHRLMSEAYPDCFVNFTLADGSFICGQPLNMAKDEQAVKDETMTWEEYEEKWYDFHEDLEKIY